MSDTGEPPRSFDLRGMRWILTVLAVATAVNGLTLKSNVSPALAPVITWSAFSVNILFGAGLCLYCGHLLARRLQASLLDFAVIVAFMGNAVGLLITLPGMRPLALQLLPIIVGWTMLGAVEGLVYARLLECGNGFKRVALLLFAWIQFLYIPFLLVAAIMFAFESAGLSRSVGTELLAFKLPLAITGLAIFGVSVIVHRRIRAAARAIVGKDIVVAKPSPADRAPLQKLQPAVD